MHAAIASSSMIPYAWMWNGPRSMTPVCGEGIEASVVTGEHSARSRDHLRARTRLKQDPEGDVPRTTAPQEVDGRVEVHVVPRCELFGGAGLVARPLELAGAPLLDPLDLCLSFLESGFSRSHLPLLRRFT